MTTASEHLVTYELSNRERYEARCDAARMGPYVAAARFEHIASQAAHELRRQFPGEAAFTAVDILLAAAALADYYATHISEADMPAPRPAAPAKDEPPALPRYLPEDKE